MIQVLIIAYVISVIVAAWTSYFAFALDEYIAFSTLIVMILVIVCPVLNTIVGINLFVYSVAHRKFKNPFFKDKDNG